MKYDWIISGAGTDMGGQGWRETNEIRFYINFLLLATSVKFFVKFSHMTDSMLASSGFFLSKKITKKLTHENWKKKYQIYIIC